MDLAKKETQDKATLEVKTIDGKKTDIRIELWSSDSDVYNDAQAEMRRKVIESGFAKMSGEESRQANALVLARCTAGWTGIQWEGKELKCTLANAKMLYNNPRLGWLRDQVYDFINRRENYLGN